VELFGSPDAALGIPSTYAKKIPVRAGPGRESLKSCMYMLMEQANCLRSLIGLIGFLFGRGKHWKEQRRQKGENSDHDEKLN
jgi:hypothetical protein